MAVEIIMPKLGVDMQEGEIIEWKKQEGDIVSEGDILLEIMSDKTNMELEAEDSGVLLKITRQAGETVPVTEVIGYIGAAGESVDGPASSKKATETSVPTTSSANAVIASKEAASTAPQVASVANAPAFGEKVRATPAARKAALDMGITLNQVPGTGPKGRIHKEDVEGFKGAQPKATPLARKIAADKGVDLAAVVGTGIGGKITKEDILAMLGAAAPAVEKAPIAEEKPAKELPEGVVIKKMSAMRKAISKGMTHSYLTAPTFTLNYDIDMTEMIALRKKLIDPIMAKTGLKVSFTDLIGLAVVKTLMKPEHEYMNASLINDANDIELHRFVNLGIAVGLDDGLVVPVVHGADKMSLSEFVLASKDVIKKAQGGKLKAAEMSGSTFSVTNLGMFGTKTFNPIINQPNSAILGVGATIPTPTVVDGEIVARPIMAMCLTIDHRLVDGMNGAKFMVDLKQLMENPFELLI
ncbi:TPA: dihydrolipoamide acetyltransferase [Streptococcus equi subsp. zooepidemicus]|uniref:Dihydrolipoamide acetyltransferase component of pyruvate dehydrogenase complex n=1 Tax=Streptococcus equi subsp. zooepidemicus (strain H70) TaxID=553483 RepID=C0MDM4_STRS7|nr:dihydrolipoamide acetyltransferase [Streptococcus equi]MCD3399180.1 dihydrolipoamide acetyltransferase [Streptococcus equi subsp. zooepidemicus]MCD3451746.1 dihydrolipoamide acetyltransferase [Streptococcus equi subsp. zooepidemicus]MCD3465700.1 dihydrolipoamide acetyltransferase [Streptococcus equi subsp. zooepidemicus]CAW98874.1 dihydrolipoamide acetyltransferase component of pyruvate dehydrogenase complex [Streptococcus equi subsp. zooepidemicus]HEK9073064.1 dihydrolipoamide acetyltransf